MTANAITDRAIVYVVIIIATTILCSAGYGLVQSVQPVHAASAAAGKLTPCDPVALAGNVVVYFCEPDDGPSFYVNSVGFMFVAD